MILIRLKNPKISPPITKFIFRSIQEQKTKFKMIITMKIPPATINYNSEKLKIITRNRKKIEQILIIVISSN